MRRPSEHNSKCCNVKVYQAFMGKKVEGPKKWQSYWWHLTYINNFHNKVYTVYGFLKNWKNRHCISKVQGQSAATIPFWICSLKFWKFTFYCLDSVSPLHNKYNVFPLKEKNGIETILSRFIPVHCWTDQNDSFGLVTRDAQESSLAPFIFFFPLAWYQSWTTE